MNSEFESPAIPTELLSVELTQFDSNTDRPFLEPNNLVTPVMPSGECGEHLHPYARAYLNEPVSMRLQRVSAEVLISYPELNHLLNEARWLIHEPRRSRARGIFIGGENGSGKTLIAKVLSKEYPVGRGRPPTDSHPRVLSINLSGVRSTKALLSRILEITSVPLANTRAVHEHERVVIETLRAMRCSLLITDETQDVLMGRQAEQIRVIEVLKRLMNELNLPVLALGTLEGKNAFRADPHMAARFEQLEIPRWKKGEKLATFLSQYEKHIPLRCRSYLSRDDIQSYLIKSTNGCLDAMLRRLRLAAEHAIVNGTEQITKSLLEKAQSHPHISALRGDGHD